MADMGRYLYGFTDRQYEPGSDLRGLGGLPVRVIPFRDLAAVVSAHPVRRLMPSRGNVEPHHRVVRQVSAKAPLVPAAFGHISETEQQIVAVLERNYDEIRGELARLAHRCEMTVKLRWGVENIFECLVRGNRELREMRDRVFRDPIPSFNAKLKVGATFEATLKRERERLTAVLLDALQDVICGSVCNAPRDEKTACHAAFLVETARTNEFVQALGPAAARFSKDFTLTYSGPWPPYSFVQLRLDPVDRTSAA